MSEIRGLMRIIDIFLQSSAHELIAKLINYREIALTNVLLLSADCPLYLWTFGLWFNVCLPCLYHTRFNVGLYFCKLLNVCIVCTRFNVGLYCLYTLYVCWIVLFVYVVCKRLNVWIVCTLFNVFCFYVFVICKCFNVCIVCTRFNVWIVCTRFNVGLYCW